MSSGLRLQAVNEGVYAVHDAHGQHVGNLKRIGAVWKFKAVGSTSVGETVPGGGPLTDRHNTVFETLPDATALNTALDLGPGPKLPTYVPSPSRA
jgi:hypothetical protein